MSEIKAAGRIPKIIRIGVHHRISVNRDGRDGTIHVHVNATKRRGISFTVDEWAEFADKVRDGSVDDLVAYLWGRP